MYNKRGQLKNIRSRLKEVFAVGDQIKKYKGSTSSERKAFIIQNLAIKYDKIIFVDDDPKNIQDVKALALFNVQAKNVNEIENA